MSTRIGKLKVSSTLQIIICFIFLFVVPTLPEKYEPTIYLITTFALFLNSASMIELHRRKYFVVAAFLILSDLINQYFKQDFLMLIDRITAIVFFTWIALLLIKQVMTKRAGIELIIEAIVGYLLLGIALIFVMGIITYFAPESFSYTGVTSGPHSMNSYFVFVTYTTVGFGDILPTTDLARSFAKLTAICGQIYISIVIGILIGKYIQEKNS